VKPRAIPRRAVAALFLERQQLDRPRARRLTAASLEAFVSGVCGLQIDSVNVLDRAHHLTLWSRFGPYDRARLERLIYRRRVVFEYLSHVACFVATRDLPIWRGIMAQIPERWRKHYGRLVSRLPLDEVERAIAEAGVANKAEADPDSRKGSAGWWNWTPTRRALDYLWKSGRIAVHSRHHFQKRYAILSRVLPHAAGVAPLPPGEIARERVLRSLAAMGAATRDDLRGYWTWPRIGTDQAAALAALRREGRVVELAVEGLAQPFFARAEDVAALDRAARVRRPSRGTTLLSPFDSFLWHRERVHRLWGYHYRIEIYVPAQHRTHGYYTLPLLHEGVPVGRVDLKLHRERGELAARHVHFEPWLARGVAPPGAHWGVPDRDAVLAGLAEALGSLATFTGADRVTLARVTPGAFKRGLGEAMRA